MIENRHHSHTSSGWIPFTAVGITLLATLGAAYLPAAIDQQPDPGSHEELSQSNDSSKEVIEETPNTGEPESPALSPFPHQPDDGTRVIGRVVNTDGEPIEGIELTLQIGFLGITYLRTESGRDKYAVWTYDPVKTDGNGNFEIAPVLTQLLKSQHFFDDNAMGVIIKSPFDLFLNFVNESGFNYSDTTLSFSIESSRLLGQEVFDPFDVAGWQRDRTWINTNFMIGRWLTAEVLIQGFFQESPEQFRTLAMEAVGAAESNTSNPETVVRALVDKFLPKGLLTPQEFENAMSVFKIEDVPENYYGSDYTPGGLGLWMLAVSMEVPQQVFLLMMHLSRQPEFQLK